MWDVVYNGQKVVRNKIICTTISYWKNLGPELPFHGVVSETAPDGVCCANISPGRGGVCPAGFSRQLLRKVPRRRP